MKNRLQKKSIICRSCIVFILLVLQTAAYAQLSANFSASDSSSCTPLVVSFRDLSTGNPVSWFWDLGNGTTSTLKNPSTIYLNPGFYTIKLTITDASGNTNSITKSSFITVYAKPSVEFTANPSSGCVPLYVSFVDQTTAGAGSITSWSWDFGDGVSDSVQNPTHIYSLADTFSVTLAVTNSFGCTQSLLKESYIRVEDTVSADFSYTYSNICNPPSNFQFKNLSTGAGGGFTYQWSFGDGGQSASANPSHTYSNAGNYTISLITTNASGCSDTSTKTVAVGADIPNFIVPPSVCVGDAVTLQDSSSPIPVKASWKFGDGTTDTGLSVVHTYTTAGTYTITYKPDFGGCIDSISKPINVVSKPVASFTSSSVLSACSTPLTVQFTNTSTGANSYVWNFGDGTTSTVASPSHTYTVTGSFNVTLTASNGVGGCSAAATKNQFVKIAPPVITGFANLPFNGCISSPVLFKAYIDTTEPIKNYLWEFGDGTTSSSVSPTHTYSTVGTYSVKLTVTSTSGCVDTFTLVNAVTLNTAPAANFSASPLDACSSVPIQFTDLSTGTITEWHWDFGDGLQSTEQNPQHEYIDTGYFDVTLYVGNNGCMDTLTLPQYMHINAPVAAFRIFSDCDNRMFKTFSDKSIDPKTWNWDFGDGTTSTIKNPTHTYNSTGIYTVTLIVTNKGCADTLTDIAYVLKEAPQFTTDALHTNFCKNDSIQFTATNFNPAYIKNFLWQFDDGNSTSGASLSVTNNKYIRAGTYDPWLITTDLNGCNDTTTSAVSLNIYGPTASFLAEAGGCKDSSIAFTDTSRTDGTHPLTKWIWNYGDGIIDSVSGRTPLHNYNSTGTYDVRLTVYDNNGCSSGVLKQDIVTITSPAANFSVSDSLRCSLSTISFINSSTGSGLAYLWNFGDGKTSTLDTPSHAYTAEGIYTVSLTITDKYSCRNTITKPNVVTIANPNASFTITSDTAATCPPLNVQIQNNSQNYSSVLWDFGDGNTSSAINPTHSYTIPGNYKLTLIVNGYGSCSDTSASQIINIKGPYGSFSFSPNGSCSPSTVSFKAATTNTVLYIWDFNDGSTQTTQTSKVNYQYKQPGLYIPKLIVQDNTGCQVPLISTDTLKVSGVFPKIVGFAQTGCDSSLVMFTDSSIVTSFDRIATRNWNFDDGFTSTDINPLHYYKKAGTYNVTVSMQTDSGCKGNYTLPITIQVNKAPKLQVTIPDSICVNTSVNYTASDKANLPDSLQWLWNFGNNDTSSAQSGVYTYTTSGTYSVSVISSVSATGCADTIQKNINIVALPPIDAGLDSVLCLNQSLTLQPTGAAQYQWLNSSSLSCTNCTSPVAKPDSTTTYFVRGRNTFGCEATDSILITVILPTHLSIAKISDTLCVGTSAQLIASGADKYTWQPSTGLNNAYIANPIASPTTIGLNNYTVIGGDYKQCFTDTAHVSILVAPLPTFNIVDTAITMNVGSSYKIHTTGSEDVVNWLWLPPYGLSCSNCAEPLAQPKSNITYTAKAITNFGCSAEDHVRIEVLCNNSNVFIPNTFSPNNDSHNDYFYPQGKGLFTIKSMRIFNRWGAMVYAKLNFTANSAADGWDGKYNGAEQPSDVYVYICDVLCDNGTVLSYKGNVTLIR